MTAPSFSTSSIKAGAVASNTALCSSVSTVSASLDVRVVLSINGALVLILGLFPASLMHLCANAVVQMLGT